VDACEALVAQLAPALPSEPAADAAPEPASAPARAASPAPTADQSPAGAGTASEPAPPLAP
jgi:hypothetical protein